MNPVISLDSPLCCLIPSSFSPLPQEIQETVIQAGLGELFEQGKYDDDYKDFKTLGRGAHATVSKTVCVNTGCCYASKRVEIAHLNQIIAECRILQLVKGPGVPKIYKLYHDTSLQSLHILEEFIEGKPLVPPFKNITDIQHIFKQLLTIIARVHAMNVAHGDITLKNILVSHQNLATIVDWAEGGRFLEDGMRASMHGTYEFMAPEQKTPPYPPKASDMWSLGIVLYKVFTGCKLFYKGIEYFTHTFTPTPDDLKTIPKDAQDLILALLQINPKDRISAEAALDHPFMQTAR